MPIFTGLAHLGVLVLPWAMSKPLSLSGFEIDVLYHEGSARVTVTQAGAPVFEAQVRAIHDLVPFRFEAGDGTVTALVSRNGRNGAVVRPGQPPVVVGSNPDFRKVAARVFVPGGHFAWAVYTAVRNILAGALFALALVWGLFSSLDPLWLGGLALVGFVGSYAIDLTRDKRVESALGELLG